MRVSLDWLVYGKAFNPHLQAVFGDYKILGMSAGLEPYRKTLPLITGALLRGIDPSRLTGEGFSYSENLKSWNGMALALFRPGRVPEIDLSGSQRSANFLEARVALASFKSSLQLGSTAALWTSVLRQLRDTPLGVQSPDNFLRELQVEIQDQDDDTACELLVNSEPAAAFAAAVSDACFTCRRIVFPFNSTEKHAELQLLWTAYDFVPPSLRSRFSFGMPAHDPHNGELLICFSEKPANTAGDQAAPYSEWLTRAIMARSVPTLKAARRKMFKRLGQSADAELVRATLDLYDALNDIPLVNARKKCADLWSRSHPEPSLVLLAATRRLVRQSSPADGLHFIREILLRFKADGNQGVNALLCRLAGTLISRAEVAKGFSEIEESVIAILAIPQGMNLLLSLQQRALNQMDQSQVYWLLEIFLSQKSPIQDSTAIQSWLESIANYPKADWQRILRCVCARGDTRFVQALVNVASKVQPSTGHPLFLFNSAIGGSAASAKECLSVILQTQGMDEVGLAIFLTSLRAGHLIADSPEVVSQLLSSLARYRANSAEMKLYQAIRKGQLSGDNVSSRSVAVLLEEAVRHNWLRVAVLLDFWALREGFNVAISSWSKTQAAADSAIGTVADILEDQDPVPVMEYISRELLWLPRSASWPFLLDRLELCVRSLNAARFFNSPSAYNRMRRAKENAEQSKQSRFIKTIIQAMNQARHTPSATSNSNRTTEPQIGNPSNLFGSYQQPVSPNLVQKAGRWVAERIRRAKKP